jgi:L-serine dehydratase
VTTSFFDLYKIGVGPSSSHTMGPMRAAFQFARGLAPHIDQVHRVQVDLYGSLALTGLGHATDRAVLLGLAGSEPATIDPEWIVSTIEAIRQSKTLRLNHEKPIAFDEPRDLIFHRDVMFPPGAHLQHPNGLRLAAFDAGGAPLSERTFFSIGGGFITEDTDGGQSASQATRAERMLPYPFRSAAELLQIAGAHNLTIAQLMMANECALAEQQGSASPEEDVRAGVLRIWQAMRDCIARGIATEGILPGGLNVRRRAHRLAERLREKEAEGKTGDPLAPLDWVTVYAMAVNEENAAGGRVVTAPTNGAAGVVPAIAQYYERFISGADTEGILRYFLTSAAFGFLY